MSDKTTITKIISALLFVLIFSMLNNSVVQAQDIRNSLFSDADKALNQANAADARLLAPDNFSKAMELFNEANRDLQRGRNLQDIREKLAESVTYFNKATEATKLANVTFTNVLSAREDAIAAKAFEFSPEKWKDAEDEFKGAAKELEDGDARDAKEEAARAEKMYRDAELTAIKSSILESARSLVRQADRVSADDQAPKTLEKAKRLINETEKALENSRYDTDEARNLAKQAEYEASHTLYLHQYIEQLDRDRKSREEVILMAEEPFKRIAGELLINAKFDKGYESVADSIIQKINGLKESLNSQEQEITSLTQEYNSLESANEDLRNKLEAITNERSEISERVQAMNEFREQFEQVNNLFSNREARVIRDGNNAVMRLTGLNFDVGSSVVKTEHFALLSKVKRAINLFPGSKITIEGHTDSQGGDDLNMKLSQERANAVMSYLLANMDIEPLRMNAKGYGETKPVANNETEQGRKMNRRIDVIIVPEGF
ncbi:hypothetical protein CK503_15635 [Aliifodinibius salipaludis]|uniref:OmpA-like domain-containing protein n=1 Tax=Fodinibius salipaludis TaxID=2032627 RepID=A0A2A2G6M9_9BACT|nr:OmpA family protein [Aliifodinibius salipaludis]PAU92664.1 hypothetical protein CK503_15635 [Aliifodinibius salipaludis]